MSVGMLLNSFGVFEPVLFNNELISNFISIIWQDKTDLTLLLMGQGHIVRAKILDF